MADTYTDTLAGLILLNDQNLAPFEASAIVRRAPFVGIAAGITASNGTLHKYNRENVAPGYGFREIGAGLSNVARKIDVVTHTLKLMDATVRRDKGEAIGYKGGPAAYMAQEILPAVAQAMFGVEKQIINGTGEDATGWEGFYDLLEDDMTVDAGGDGGARVYVVTSAPDKVAVVAGMDGRIEVGEVMEFDLQDGDGDPYTGLVCSILGWMGVQVTAPTRQLSAIVNLDSTATHLLTRSRLMDALTLIREQGEEPTHVLMSATMREEYRTSLEAAAYSVTDTPGTVDGVPIVTVNSINEDAAGS